ncbi:MAG: conjugal transfer protein TrbF [Acidobacteriota bacterium]
MVLRAVASPRASVIGPSSSPEGEGSAWLKARGVWDERYGTLARRAHNWMLMAFALIVLDSLLAAALFWLASQTKITPYVVEMDKLGQAVAFGPADQLKEPAERLYRYQLAIFIYNIRAVFADPQAQVVNISRAYPYVAGDAQLFLSNYFRTNNPLERAKTETVAVQVTSVLRLSPKTWQVQWRELHSTTLTQRPTEEHWQAALTTEVNPPTDAEKILDNPLGLYIVSINWTRTNQ